MGEIFGESVPLSSTLEAYSLIPDQARQLAKLIEGVLHDE